MPRNSNGDYVLPSASFQPNTTVSSSAVNADFSDIATTLTDSVASNGVTSITAPLKNPAGTSSAPGISFEDDTSSGIYLPAEDKVGLVSGGVGILNNSLAYACSGAPVIVAGGNGYAVGDEITLTGGTYVTPVTVQVATLSGSAVATVTLKTGGRYTVQPSNPVAQGSTTGSGNSATFTVTWASALLLTDLTGANLGQSLGASSYATNTLFQLGTANDLIRQVFGSLGTAGQAAVSNGGNTPPTFQSSIFVSRSYLAGLTLSAAGSTGTFGIAAGTAADSSNTAMMSLASAYTKTTSAWAVGTGNGSLDTGTIATSSWYAVYLIERVDTSVVDVLITLETAGSAPSPTLPTNYTLSRYIGSMKTDGSSQWVAFTQAGDEFLWSVPVFDINGTTAAASAILLTLTVPRGVVVNALFSASLLSNTANQAILFSSPAITDTAAVNTGTPGLSTTVTQTGQWLSATINIRTNTSAQIRARGSSAATNAIYGTTMGWVDRRGRDN